MTSESVTFTAASEELHRRGDFATARQSLEQHRPTMVAPRPNKMARDGRSTSSSSSAAGNNAGSCLTIEDCESTVTMRVRCRRAQLLAMIPVLILFSLLTNVSLIRKHHQQIAPKSGGGKKRRMLPGEKALRANKKPEARPVVTPRAQSLQANATFSACLLIKDDNDILNEWLAYHYFVLKLRHLIVAVDPLSSQSPSEVLQRWRLMTDLQIYEWTDATYMPESFMRDGRPPDKYMQTASDFDQAISEEAMLEISNHRYRQRVFLAQCMKKHRELGNSWVIHIDTDEYIVASKLLRQMKPDYLSIPPMDQSGSVLDLIQQVVGKTSELVSYPCISMLRVLFGSVESEPEERNDKVPAGFNSTSFETLRWRYHALPHNMTLHGNPKVIVDVAAIPEKYLPEVVFSIHRPVAAFCHKNKDLTFTSFRKQPIAVNHYLGSWERYSGRDDRRRSRSVYDAKANQRRGQDDGVRPWLMGFVRELGYKTASKLLGKEYLAQIDENKVMGWTNATVQNSTAVQR